MGIRHASEPGLWPLLLTLWLPAGPDAVRPAQSPKPAFETPAEPAPSLPASIAPREG